MNPLEMGFRRRCGWCGLTLRAWQLNLCRRCRKAVKYDQPGPPCGHMSRIEEEPDRWRNDR